MSPLEFMQGLAALVPRPRLHLIRFHGVLAPNGSLRPGAQAQCSLAVQQAALVGVTAARLQTFSLSVGTSFLKASLWRRIDALSLPPTTCGRSSA